MSAISDYVGRVNAKLDSIATGIEGLASSLGGLGTAVGGIADDVLFLKETIQKLQNNPGPISPEDQVLLDALEARVTTTAESIGTLNTNLGALKTAAEQLNAATERPAPPVEPS